MYVDRQKPTRKIPVESASEVLKVPLLQFPKILATVDGVIDGVVKGAGNKKRSTMNKMKTQIFLLLGILSGKHQITGIVDGKALVSSFPEIGASQVII